MLASVHRFLFEGAVYRDEHRERNEDRDSVGNRLREDDSPHPENPVQREDERKEHDALPRYCERERLHRFSHRLEGEVQHEHDADDGRGDHERVDYADSEVHDSLVLAENVDNL